MPLVCRREEILWMWCSVVFHIVQFQGRVCVKGEDVTLLKGPLEGFEVSLIGLDILHMKTFINIFFLCMFVKCFHQ